MTDRPIIFSTPLVRALLDGRKTQTRRILKLQPKLFAIDGSGTLCEVGLLHVDGDPLPRVTTGRVITRQEVRFAVGDRLWVREAHAVLAHPHSGRPGNVAYRAEHDEDRASGPRVDIRWRPSIHMPRWASRLTLTATDVRVQRLTEITEVDAIDEGAMLIELEAHGAPTEFGRPPLGASPRRRFEHLWRSLHGPEAWDANPWIVALTFDVDHRNIDSLPGIAFQARPAPTTEARS